MGQNATSEKLNDKQRRAIRAILTERTITSAAQKAGVSRSTIYRWLEQPAFVAALTQASDATQKAIAARLTGLLDRSLDVVGEALGNGDAKIRLRAALGLLSRYDGLAEYLDLTARVSELERKVKLSGGGQ
ncbi:MAG: helix-turn-helix domain-containing protein [Chloroflexi bacterium]|nr:helix-turn-helix domain-containing protein [Chloroflexota bacterium]